MSHTDYLNHQLKILRDDLEHFNRFMDDMIALKKETLEMILDVKRQIYKLENQEKC